MLAPGTKLGRRERLLLLNALPFRDVNWVPLPVLPGSDGVAQRRAVGSLVRKGLLIVARDPKRVGLLQVEANPLRASGYLRIESQHPHPAFSGRRLRFILRTPLGDAVVAHYGPELEAASDPETPLPRIRWAASCDVPRPRRLTESEYAQAAFLGPER